jgi:hypothetical protein
MRFLKVFASRYAAGGRESVAPWHLLRAPDGKSARNAGYAMSPRA